MTEDDDAGTLRIEIETAWVRNRFPASLRYQGLDLFSLDNNLSLETS
jgi:hypothetical protein